jgi:hypothetical protein
MNKNIDLSLNVIKKGIIFLAILGLILGFSTVVLAQNSSGKVLPARNASPARSDATFSGEPIETGGSGRIDEKAAFAVREEGATQEIDCDQWPEKFWVFLYGAYLFLLVFNLSFGLKKKKIQWFWESLITLLALWTWKELDVCQMQRWFYYCILESGVIIYFFYAYFLLASKKKGS